MCVIDYITELDEFTGYKILAVNDAGDFYSSFTGGPFKVGEVKPFEGMVNKLSDYWNRSLEEFPLEKLIFYRREFNGKTSVFENFIECKSLFSDMLDFKCKSAIKLVMVKVTLKGIIWEGHYGHSQVYISSTVTNIERV